MALTVVAVLGCVAESHPEPLMVLSGPKDVVRIEVRNEAGDALWILHAPQACDLDVVFYGVVPTGFEQLEPTDASLPRPLEPGELITVETKTLKRRFAHAGIAKSRSAIEIVDYSMELLRPTE